MSFDYPYAGLILPDAQDLSPAPYLDSAARVLARLFPQDDRNVPTHCDGARVFGDHIGISVIPEEQSDYGPRVRLEVVTADGRPPDETDAARLLSDTVYDALDHSSADILEWYSPEVLIDREDFIRLRKLVSPRRIGQIDSTVEDALFESANAAQGICGALYPDASDAAPQETPAALPAETPPARSGFFGLRRVGQMAAVTSLLAVLTSTGQVQLLFNQFLP
ncbi:hypothetical protein [Antarctobacter heliothermus]|uniref:Uncharacterized protein n=1 Tax=Antarctobacter heliothermus TaxID=74033 RepID=A0A239H7B5_9RHOB|nr:hypothetical protein [Antarctobacter heliothermus]SNS77277.1 hypothetical protein SAMN04488078_103144 [Antarctobacter heliothermus]